MPRVPDTMEEVLEPTWLSEALSERFPATVVERVEASAFLHGVGTKALVSLTYRDPTPLPSQLCIKAGFEPHNRHILEGGTYMKEARFYGSIAPELPLTVPTCYYSGYDETSKQGILILEDLRASGAQFGSASRGNSLDEAAQFLDSLAALHARYWDGKIAAAHPWVVRERIVTGSSAPIYTERIRSNLEDGRAATLPAELTDDKKILTAWELLANLVATEPVCLVHGDPHAGNLYLTSEGCPGFYDWQTVHGSSWATDVPYYLSAALSHNDRRRSVEDLLKHYLERLAGYGVTPPTWDQAWLTYRQFLVYGFYMWVITRPIVQPVEVINIFVDRLGNAMADVDAYAALGL